MSKPKLTGERCECVGCGAMFARLGTFTAHQVGPPESRRCLTAEEMTAKGWRFSDPGLWRGKPATKGLFYERAQAAKAITQVGR